MKADKFSAPPLSAPLLCVDFDGTLVRADSLDECVLAALKSYPVGLLRILCRRYHSRAEFKAALVGVARDGVDVASFPREPRVVASSQRPAAKVGASSSSAHLTTNCCVPTPP